MSRNLLKSLMTYFLPKNTIGIKEDWIKDAQAKGVYRKRSIYDEHDNELTCEDSNGYWQKSEYDENGNLLSCRDSTGFWNASTYDKNNNMLTYKDWTGFWFEKTFDENSVQTSCKSSSKV